MGRGQRDICSETVSLSNLTYLSSVTWNEGQPDVCHGCIKILDQTAVDLSRMKPKHSVSASTRSCRSQLFKWTAWEAVMQTLSDQFSSRHVCTENKSQAGRNCIWCVNQSSCSGSWTPHQRSWYYCYLLLLGKVCLCWQNLCYINTSAIGRFWVRQICVRLGVRWKFKMGRNALCVLPFAQCGVYFLISVAAFFFFSF